jgi:hypothetical protein
MSTNFNAAAKRPDPSNPKGTKEGPSSWISMYFDVLSLLAFHAFFVAELAFCGDVNFDIPAN